MKQPLTLFQRIGKAVAKAAVGVTQIPYSALEDGSSGFWHSVQESFPGAWQRNIVIESPKNLMAFSAVFACVNMIAKDISKLRPLLKQKKDGIWVDANPDSPFWRSLRKPNYYQNYMQFMMSWISSKLMHGNTYVLLERDKATRVRAMYVLDPRMVSISVTDDGGIYYTIKKDNLSHPEDLGEITVPASEIIHDRAVTLWHPLVGVSPLYAAGLSATQGLKIQKNSAIFFENMSRPSGMLTAPNRIEDETAKRLKSEFEKNFSGANLGRLMVAGDGLTYAPFTMPPEQAQMIQQLKWTIEDVARPFNIPLYKLGSGENPKFANFSAMNQDYYTQTLQELIEAVEVCLSEGLEINNDTSVEYAVKLDVANLLRMDPLGRAESNTKLVGGGIKAPNEARQEEDLPPVDGGQVPYMQQQNWPITELFKRPMPAATMADPVPPAAPPKSLSDDNVESDYTEIKTFISHLVSKLEEDTHA